VVPLPKSSLLPQGTDAKGSALRPRRARDMVRHIGQSDAGRDSRRQRKKVEDAVRAFEAQPPPRPAEAARSEWCPQRVPAGRDSSKRPQICETDHQDSCPILGCRCSSSRRRCWRPERGLARWRVALHAGRGDPHQRALLHVFQQNQTYGDMAVKTPRLVMFLIAIISRAMHNFRLVLTCGQRVQ
jgi:hypothetical protein